LILEAADYGGWEKKKRDNFGKEIPCPPTPPLLELALHCKTWNSLPRAGGILDQPYGLMQRLTAVYNVYSAFKLFANERMPGHEGDFANEHPAEYELIKLIRNMKNDAQS